MTTTFTTPLNLTEVDPCLHEQAREAFANSDAGRFVISANSNTSALALVFDNWAQLKQEGMFEECLLHAFNSTRTNNAGWSVRTSYSTQPRAYTSLRRSRGAGVPVACSPGGLTMRGT